MIFSLYHTPCSAVFFYKLNFMSYFFELLKNNAIFFSIIISGNFSGIDNSQLIGVDHFFPTDSGLFISKYSFGENNFSNVTVILHKELGTVISLQTSDSKYFEHPEYYFGKASEEQIRNPYEMDGEIVKRSKKKLGKFKQFGKLIDVTIFKSSSYGYDISLKITEDATNETN